MHRIWWIIHDLLYWFNHHSKIFPSRQHFLAGRTQDQSVLPLGNIAPFIIRQWRIWIHDSALHEVSQGQNVAREVQLLEPSFGKG